MARRFDQKLRGRRDSGTWFVGMRAIDVIDGAD
jgi:hypothetical protein